MERPTELLGFLRAAWPDVKRKTLQNWLKFRRVTVNGRAVTQFNHPLQAGDVVALGGETVAEPGSRLGSGIRIRFEDEHLIVIEKPSGLLSMASERERDRTAFAQLMKHVRRGNPRSRERVFIVHRLDKETSGLMVFARSESVKAQLQSHWGETTKRYLAVTEGRPSKPAGRFESHLDESDPLRVKSLEQAGAKSRHAVTDYRLVRAGARCALIELTLVTGRRHQIRVQLAGAGCPIVGDQRYGARTDPAGRLGLHSFQLKFQHPVTGEPKSFESAPPRELSGFEGW